MQSAIYFGNAGECLWAAILKTAGLPDQCRLDAYRKVLPIAVDDSFE